MTSEIRTIEKRLVYDDPMNRWVKLYFDRVQFPNGSQGFYNKIVEGTGVPGVAVLPISVRGVGLVRQHRYAIDRDVWEIPRGYGDSDDPSREAKRELVEETGLHAIELIPLGPMHPNSAVFATVVELFAARCNPEGGVASSDGNEDIEFRWFPVAEALRAAESGTITDAFTLSALLRGKLRGLL